MNHLQAFIFKLIPTFILSTCIWITLLLDDNSGGQEASTIYCLTPFMFVERNEYMTKYMALDYIS